MKLKFGPDSVEMDGVALSYQDAGVRLAHDKRFRVLAAAIMNALKAGRRRPKDEQSRLMRNTHDRLVAKLSKGGPCTGKITPRD